MAIEICFFTPQSSKQAVKKEKPNAKVLVHESSIAQRAVMDFMQPARRRKPASQ